jgi:hypothetical protein
MQTKAINFAIERQRHRGFVGRRALLARLDQLLVEAPADRWVVVTGGPGMGKSALLSAWLARREAVRELVPHHFIRRQWANWDDPASLVASLVAQIEARFPDLPEPEADANLSPAARLAATLGRLSQDALVPRGERLVVLIDGLDEYDPPPGPVPSDPLGAFLPYELPPGVSFLCASRPRHPYVDVLATRGVLMQLDLDDARQFATDNEATVRAFWEQAAPPLGLDARFIEEAVRRAGGNLQHGAMLRQHLAGVPPPQRRVENIPRGLAALIASAWERIATDAAIVDGLGVLCAARDALTIDEVAVVSGWTGGFVRPDAQGVGPGNGARNRHAARPRPGMGKSAGLAHGRPCGRERGRPCAAPLHPLRRLRLGRFSEVRRFAGGADRGAGSRAARAGGRRAHAPRGPVGRGPVAGGLCRTTSLIRGASALSC